METKTSQQIIEIVEKKAAYIFSQINEETTKEVRNFLQIHTLTEVYANLILVLIGIKETDYKTEHAYILKKYNLQ